MEKTRKSQTRCEAGAESHGSLSRREIAGLPGVRQSGFFILVARSAIPSIHQPYKGHIQPEAETTMKRGILLILMLLLLIDLGEDGGFGKAEFVAPDSNAKISLNSFQQSDSGQIDSSQLLLSSDWRDLLGHSQSQPIKPRDQLAQAREWFY
jgi:hypothetical protein